MYIMSKIPVYFIPGMCASPSIFDKIKLPSESFDVFFLEWMIPLKKETLVAYAERITQNIKHDNPVLIGVSFGGILVQEMANCIKTRKIIIISSVKSNQEFSSLIKTLKITKVYRLIPTRMMKIEYFVKFILNQRKKEHAKLYAKFLTVIDPLYLNWAIEQIVQWNRRVPDEKVIHIHGDLDEVFPINNIKRCIPVKGGQHSMIITKCKWMNNNLSKIIIK